MPKDTPQKAGRPAKTAIIPAPIDPKLDQHKLAGAMDAMRDQAQEDQLELLELAGDVGALRALEMTRSLVAAATVRIFQKVRESNQINKLPIRLSDGSVATATNLDEFCRLAFGRHRAVMFEASETLEVLGDQAYEAANRLGLNRSALRAARALPPDKLEIIRLAISTGSSKVEVLAVIEDLAEKVQQAESATTEARAELKAAEDLLATKGKTIDRLQRDLKRIEKLPLDQQLVDIKQKATAIAADAEGAIQGGLRQALIAVNSHGDERGQHDVFLAGLVGQVQAELNALRHEFNLPDVSNAADQRLAADMEVWDKR